jgi:hypothetical protein
MGLRTEIDANGWLPLPESELALQESEDSSIGTPRDFRTQEPNQAPRRDQGTAAAQSREDDGNQRKHGSPLEARGS